ncbi:MAG: DoxX family protein [Bacteroidetes bacterium]|jgi:hypothetical protein|nr:DoxX family protein [Bacteroidota bacterium]
MTTKTRNIINWSLAGIVGFIFTGSAISKFIGAEAAEMAQGIGLDKSTFMFLGVVELLSVVLFLIPRTGVLGTLLLAAYMGGAIATHLEHGEPLMFPIAVQAFVWIVAVLRFPELTQRILDKRTT